MLNGIPARITHCSGWGSCWGTISLSYRMLNTSGPQMFTALPVSGTEKYR